MAEETVVSLDSLARGAAIERFQDALERLVENALDVNTSATKKREITLKVAVTPDKSRSMATVSISCESKLAGPEVVDTTIYLGRKNGKPTATEYNPDQPTMFDAVPLSKVN